jgi:hypothetical protein
MKVKKGRGKAGVFVALLFSIAVLLVFLYFGSDIIPPVEYSTASSEQDVLSIVTTPKPFIATHLKTPEPLRGVYMTSWVAGTPLLRDKVIRLIDTTELNAVVIDIKDDTGRISYEVSDPDLKEIGSQEDRIKDLKDFIAEFHERQIYVIGRMAVFQDPYMVKKKPEWAVKKASDGAVWRDRKGLSWIDPGAKENWDYIIKIAKDAYKAGFDEINFDYIRFPSDGNMSDITYPYSENRIKADVIKDFFAYLHENLSGGKMKISADLFGMTTTNTDDLNIGQVLENAFPYFDYIAPMVYPSHYPSGFYGIPNVNAVPYDVVKISMQSAVNRLKVYNDTVASTTVQFRPWLQDNDYPVHYTPEMVRAQMQATYDVGLTSWSLWDAANTYTRAALLDQ